VYRVTVLIGNNFVNFILQKTFIARKRMLPWQMLI
jgi:hypothetical protein